MSLSTETPSRMPLSDPRGFVEYAERITNATDVEATIAAYAANAVLELVTDGTLSVYRGIEEIRGGIEIMWSTARQRGLRIAKELVAASDDTLVNTWSGRFGGRDTLGVEIWRMNGEGKVVHHRMFQSLDVRPDVSAIQQFRALFLYPRNAAAFFAARRRFDQR